MRLNYFPSLILARKKRGDGSVNTTNSAKLKWRKSATFRNQEQNYENTWHFKDIEDQVLTLFSIASVKRRTGTRKNFSVARYSPTLFCESCPRLRQIKLKFIVTARILRKKSLNDEWTVGERYSIYQIKTLIFCFQLQIECWEGLLTVVFKNGQKSRIGELIMF